MVLYETIYYSQYYWNIIHDRIQTVKIFIFPFKVNMLLNLAWKRKRNTTKGRGKYNLNLKMTLTVKVIDITLLMHRSDLYLNKRTIRQLIWIFNVWYYHKKIVISNFWIWLQLIVSFLCCLLQNSGKIKGSFLHRPSLQKLLVQFHTNFTGMIITKYCYAYCQHFPVQWLLIDL